MGISAFAEINTRALSSFDAVMTHLGLAGGKQRGPEYLPLNPKRADQTSGSFSINRDTGAWADFASGDKGGDLISLAAYLSNSRQGEAAKRLGELLGVSTGVAPAEKTTATPRNADAGIWIAPVPDSAPAAPKAHSRHGKPSQTWMYRDREGRALFHHARFDFPKEPERGKEFCPLTLWQSATGKLEWRWKAPPAPRPLYGLQLLAANERRPVVITEGEKACDAAARLFPDLACVTWQGGAQAVTKADLSPLVGKEIWIWRDNDD
ncbi:MAG: hypothetical protein ACREV9_17770, partial [Burkholderiales bacterium]